MALGLIGIAVMLFAPRGLWGLISPTAPGIALFPVQRRLVGADHDQEERLTHG